MYVATPPPMLRAGPLTPTAVLLAAVAQPDGSRAGTTGITGMAGTAASTSTTSTAGSTGTTGTAASTSTTSTAGSTGTTGMAGATALLLPGAAPGSSTGLRATPADTAISVRRENLNVLAGRPVTIAGKLLHGAGRLDRRSPGLAGATVLLQVRGRRGGWHTLAGTHTGARGRYRLRYVPRRIGSEFLRMRFAGSAGERGSHRLLGTLSVFREVAATPSMTRFVRCVTERESGMRWHIVDPPYSGGDQWTQTTWLAAGGGRFAPTAAEATPQQQARIFLDYEPRHPEAWPVTVPACS